MGAGVLGLIWGEMQELEISAWEVRSRMWLRAGRVLRWRG